MSAMRLYVMRHGPAEDHAASGEDFDRTLTAVGAERVREVAQELRRRGEIPGRVLTSPLVRAVQTAQILCAIFGDLVHEVEPELAPSGNSVRLARDLAAGSERNDSVLFVSHAPDVSILVQALTQDRAHGFSAGMVVALEASGDYAERRFIIDPTGPNAR